MTLTIDQPAYFDRLAEVDAAHWWSRGLWRLGAYWLSAVLEGRRSLGALDVGCGTGATALRLAARPEVAHVVGLDPSPEALAHARRRHGFPLVLGSALDLPFQDGEMDLVTCFDVIQHLPEGTGRRAAAEIRRVLRGGGTALVRSNARSDFGIGDLAGLFASEGFAIRNASRANCLPALAQELRGWIGGGRSEGRGGPSEGGLTIRMPPPWRNRMLGAVATLEAALAGRLGVTLPFGHSTMILAIKIV